jgi:Ca2+-binding EF-hand superfamily protein
LIYFLVAFKIYDMDKDGFISNGNNCETRQIERMR